MAIVKPFQAIRPQPNQAKNVASVPYDVINTDEARSLASGNPNSFLHVIKSEIDLASGCDPYAPEVYSKARENLLNALENGLLLHDTDSALYVYQISIDAHSQTGIVGLSSVKEYRDGVVKIHELTRPEKEDDRVRHILTTCAQCGPVFLTYRAQSNIDNIINEETSKEPLYDFTADDGVCHTVWKAVRSTELSAAFESVGCTYIADGHHRAKSAERVHSEIEKRNDSSSEESSQYFLTVLFPDEQVNILPYNRIVAKSSKSTEQILELLQKLFEISPCTDPTPKQQRQFCMFLDGSWYNLTLKPDISIGKSQVAQLDVSILQEQILSPIFNIGDPRTDSNIGFVGGSRGTNELEKLVSSGKAKVAFSMHPVSVDQLVSIADAGELMPPKSTWFEPKLRSGLFVYKCITQ